jgi:hypothetical protein
MEPSSCYLYIESNAHKSLPISSCMDVNVLSHIITCYRSLVLSATHARLHMHTSRGQKMMSPTNPKPPLHKQQQPSKLLLELPVQGVLAQVLVVLHELQALGGVAAVLRNLTCDESRKVQGWARSARRALGLGRGTVAHRVCLKETTPRVTTESSSVRPFGGPLTAFDGPRCFDVFGVSLTRETKALCDRVSSAPHFRDAMRKMPRFILRPSRPRAWRGSCFACIFHTTNRVPSVTCIATCLAPPRLSVPCTPG